MNTKQTEQQSLAVREATKREALLKRLAKKPPPELKRVVRKHVSMLTELEQELNEKHCQERQTMYEQQNRRVFAKAVRFNPDCPETTSV